MLMTNFSAFLWLSKTEVAKMNNVPEQFVSITTLAEKLNSGETTSVEICQSYIDRCNAVEDSVKAFRSINAEQILADAKAADERRAAGKSLSQFDGIPIGIKDNISVKGDACGCASKILETYEAPYDATVITKLKEAGFICFGRLNMDEFAMGSTTENSAYEKTTNPFNSDYVPGGSSGGSAAAVAAGECPATLGSDTGGSIRQPANFCGVVGLKPTYGRVSRFGLVAFASSLDQIGPLTVNVKDAALLLDFMVGEDKFDSTTVANQETGFLAALEEKCEPMKIGVPYEYLHNEGLNPEVKEATERAIEQLKAAGHEIVDIKLPHAEYAISAYYVIATAEASTNLARFEGVRYGNRKDGENLLEMYTKTRSEGFGSEVKRRILLGTFVLSSGYYDAYYRQAQKVRTLIKQDFTNAFESCDVILTPVTPSTAFEFNATKNPLELYLSDIFTISLNLAGNCGISVPNGNASNGLPIGVQFIGPVLGEKQLLKAAYEFEQLAKEAK